MCKIIFIFSLLFSNTCFATPLSWEKNVKIVNTVERIRVYQIVSLVKSSGICKMGLFNRVILRKKIVIAAMSFSDFAWNEKRNKKIKGIVLKKCAPKKPTKKTLK